MTEDKTPGTMLVGVRIPYHHFTLLEAVRKVRGDETRTDTLRAAIQMFLKAHMEDVQL